MTRSNAITTVALDALLCGGLSILLFAPLLLFGPGLLADLDPSRIAVASALLNFPHFVASYGLVYRSRDMVRRHPFAAVWVPLGLAALCVAAVLVEPSRPEGTRLILLIASVYLSWHYTGQAFGMMASFAGLEGTPFDPAERALVKAGIRCLLGWQVCWTLRHQDAFPLLNAAIGPVYRIAVVLLPLSLLLGGAGLLRLRRRTGREVPLRVVLPWMAIHVWHAVMYRHPRALYLVQLAHCLQYLPFPLRMELNRATAPLSPRRAAGLGMLLWTAGLVGLYLLPQAMMAFRLRWWIAPEPAAALAGSSLLLALLVAAALMGSRSALARGLPDTRALLYGMALLLAGCLAFWLGPILVRSLVAALPGGAGRAVAAATLVGAFLNIHHYFTDGCTWKVSAPEVRRQLFAHLAPRDAA